MRGLYRWELLRLYHVITVPQSGGESETFTPQSKTLLPLIHAQRLRVIVLHGQPGELPGSGLSRLLSLYGYGHTVVPSPQNPLETLLLLYHLSDTGRSCLPIEQLGKPLYEALTTSGMRGTLGISTEKLGMTELPQAYAEALQALSQRPLNQHTGLWFIFNNEGSRRLVEASWDKTNHLLFFVESGKVDQAVETAEGLFSFYGELEEQEAPTLMQVKLHCQKLIADIQVLADRHGISGFASDDGISVVTRCFEPDELRTVFINIVADVAARFASIHVYPSSELAQNMKKYIEYNYNQVLTLEVMASLFYIHPVYCSILFKEKIGENLHDYVKRIRLDHAKKLLSDSPYKVERISRLVGYENTKYFYRLFTKEVGMTPAEYRAQREERAIH